MMKIIDPIDRKLIKEELNAKTFIRSTRKGGNEIYIVNNHNAPNVLKEIGRLREITFRASGGGTGNSIDLDHYDTDEICYEQLIVWSPEDEEIVGGYRYIKCNNAITESNEILLSTTHYFDFSELFVQTFLPYTIELGRSWVQPNYQPSINPRKGLFALDNIWDGLGALIKFNPEIKYFLERSPCIQITIPKHEISFFNLCTNTSLTPKTCSPLTILLITQAIMRKICNRSQDLNLKKHIKY